MTTRLHPETADLSGSVSAQPIPSGSARASDVSGVAAPTMATTYLTGTLAFLVTVVAVFAAQFTLQPPLTYAVEGASLFCLALIGACVVGVNFRALARLSAKASTDLLSMESKLTEIANRDDLTQLGNRRFFYVRLQEELRRSADAKRSTAILMIDVDALKAINDEFGHLAGDAALVSLAKLMTKCARPADVVARLGGDEFAIIMPKTDSRGASALAKRLWRELDSNPVHLTPDTAIYLGVSIGVSGFPWKGDDPQSLVHWADADLYANKLARKGIAKGFFGRDCSEFASGVVGVLCAALDIRDKLTHRHSQRVAGMAVAVGRRLGLGEPHLTHLTQAAILHDIGKIGVADSVLSKPAALNDTEWKEVRRHPELGYELLKGFEFLKDAAEMVLAHHERYDGEGYPKGLAGEEIPYAARIFQVIDAFDAMTSRRPYRQPLSREQALEELLRNAGTQFDSQMVHAFVEAMGEDVVQPESDSLLIAGIASSGSERRRWSSAPIPVGTGMA